MKKQAFNPYLPCNEYVPDGEPHVFGDRLYIYGSHDCFAGMAFCLNDYVCWSAPIDDLGDWRYEGVIYRKVQDPENAAGIFPLYAPDVAQGPDGRYYLFYCLASRVRQAVAVCDSPAGQYKFYGYVHDKAGRLLGERKGDCMCFDPAVLVDDDSRVHLYTGQAPMGGRFGKYMSGSRDHAKHVELAPDMLTMSDEPKPVVPSVTDSAGTGFEGHEFFEASSIRKFDGKYYYIYSSVLSHELCWAVSDKPDGGFSYGGTLVSNGDIGLGESFGYNMNEVGRGSNLKVMNYVGNTHGSVIEIGGEYYVFYHRHTNRHMFSRQGCAERLVRDENGGFLQAEMTSCGLNGAPLAGLGEYPAYIACQLQSAKGALFSVHPMIQNKKHPAFTQDVPDCEEDSHQYINNMRDGAVAVFKYFSLGKATQLSVTVRGKCSGSFVVRDARGGAVLARIPLKPCKEWSKFSGEFSCSESVKPLCFFYEGRGHVDFLGFELT